MNVVLFHNLSRAECANLLYIEAGAAVKCFLNSSLQLLLLLWHSTLRGTASLVATVTEIASPSLDCIIWPSSDSPGA